MINASASFICDNCMHKSICKSVEDAKKFTDAYNEFVTNSTLTGEEAFSFSRAPLICSHRDVNYSSLK